MMSIRVLVGDDHPVVRAGLQMLIDDSDGLRFVGEAGTTREAVDEALRLRPDVLVLDMRMPGGGDGIDAARRIAALEPGVAILLLTMHDDPGAAAAALRAGARGFVLKDAGADAVVRAIRAVAAGELIVGADVAGGLVELLAQAPSPVAQAFPQLTRASARSPSCSRPRRATARSPARSGCPPRRCATTSRASATSSACSIALRRCSGSGSPGERAFVPA
jgi:DNA-binding NarL/FixJ family response regulator